MKIIYIADDGKVFDNEFECEMYEWLLMGFCSYDDIAEKSIYKWDNEKSRFIKVED